LLHLRILVFRWFYWMLIKMHGYFFLIVIFPFLYNKCKFESASKVVCKLFHFFYDTKQQAPVETSALVNKLNGSSGEGWARRVNWAYRYWMRFLKMESKVLVSSFVILCYEFCASAMKRWLMFSGCRKEFSTTFGYI